MELRSAFFRGPLSNAFRRKAGIHPFLPLPTACILGAHECTRAPVVLLNRSSNSLFDPRDIWSGLPARAKVGGAAGHGARSHRRTEPDVLRLCNDKLRRRALP